MFFGDNSKVIMIWGDPFTLIETLADGRIITSGIPIKQNKYFCYRMRQFSDKQMYYDDSIRKEFVYRLNNFDNNMLKKELIEKVNHPTKLIRFLDNGGSIDDFIYIYG
jgi:hypothetical protein